MFPHDVPAQASAPCTPPCYAQTAVELAHHITPANYTYPPYNVLRYGADPSGSSSSLSAFQNAYVAATAMTPHAPIYIPTGRYLIPFPGLSWSNQQQGIQDIRVSGDGPQQSVLVGDDGNSYTIFTISSDTGHGTTGLNLNLCNFGVQNGAAAGQNALKVADFLYGRFDNLLLYASGNALTMAGMAERRRLSKRP